MPEVPFEKDLPCPLRCEGGRETGTAVTLFSFLRNAPPDRGLSSHGTRGYNSTLLLNYEELQCTFQKWDKVTHPTFLVIPILYCLMVVRMSPAQAA